MRKVCDFAKFFHWNEKILQDRTFGDWREIDLSIDRSNPIEKRRQSVGLSSFALFFSMHGHFLVDVGKSCQCFV